MPAPWEHGERKKCALFAQPTHLTLVQANHHRTAVKPAAVLLSGECTHLLKLRTQCNLDATTSEGAGCDGQRDLGRSLSCHLATAYHQMPSF